MLPRSPEELLDYVPDVSPVAVRLASRGWPGPLEVFVKNGHPSSLTTQLAASVQARLYDPSGYLGLSIPRHEALGHVARLTSGPLVVAPAPFSGRGGLATEAQQVSGAVALAIDGGSISQPTHATRVRIDGTRCAMEREGKLSQRQLVEMTQLSLSWFVPQHMPLADGGDAPQS